MILSEAQIASLAEQTLARISAPADAALLLEGSIAEGFGNSRSDIDFLLVADQEADMPTMPTIFFVDGRRVEIRTRSVGQITRHLLDVAGHRGRITRLDEHLLNRCQRFLRGYPVRGADLIRKVRDNLAYEDFAAVMTKWWAEHARQSVRHAVMLTALGQPEPAAGWMRAGLQQAAKSWAARHGETYLEPKWLSLQLDRLAADPLVERYRRGEATAADLGVTGCDERPGQLTVERPREVTTWQIGDRVHLVRDRQDVFVLGAEAARAWRRIVWGRPLVSPADPPGTGDLVAAFVRFGLIRVAWRGSDITPRLPLAAPAGSVTPAPAMTQPILSISGANPTHPRSIDLVPLPAHRFAAAAMALVWGNVMVENAVEDLRGALDREQWGVAALATARAVNGGLRALLCAHGVSPLPSDPDLIHRLDLLPTPQPRIAELARSLSDGTPDLTALAEFVTAVRAATGGDAFPSSFDSADGWQHTLDIGYDWLRLGAYLDQQLPLDEAQDLLSSGGAQPHTTTKEAR
ncbi:hypothetical protein GCM10010172_63440 [Paractinoplanes ferrugineus]|uniref:Polymerase nucleotidyl transferase domain-containing protein n=1 Tax=Paractinoplanes ferrugineus TaxID=113564 RepID=A0A919JBW1_9ACTN|nr:hypothetical protein [Actinoplanes ferrugineus]GIE16464.1 hypothetical protein Afe05nite_83040 [Actinoplanes ferrugineus]